MTCRGGTIGGSDIHHLLTMPPYGCARRLWYDKAGERRGVVADYPFVGNRHTRRGVALESQAIFELTVSTGRSVAHIQRLVAQEPPWASVSVDGLLAPPEGSRRLEGDGVLEVKCPTARSYYLQKRQDTPPADAWAQVQWGMEVTGKQWGAVLLFCADAWDWRLWDGIGIDFGFLDGVKELGQIFMDSLSQAENPCARLDPRDRRCRRCPWRLTCQGLARGVEGSDLYMVEELGPEPVVDETFCEQVRGYRQAKNAYDEAKRAYESAKAELLGRFPDSPGSVRCAEGTAVVSRVERKAYTTTVRASTYYTLKVLPPDQGEEVMRDE